MIVTRKPGTFASGAIVLLILALGRMFLSNAKKEKKRQDQLLLKQMAYTTQVTIEKGKRVIDSLLKLRGAVYVYSNDSAADAGWLPNLTDYTTTGNVASIAMKAYSLDEFMQHPDSLGFLLVSRSSDSAMARVDEYRLFEGDSAGKHIWFRAYDSQDRMPKDSERVRRWPAIYGGKFQSAWGKGYNEPEELKQLLADDWILTGLLGGVKEVKGFRLYMIGTEYEHISESDFATAIRLLNRHLHKKGIDTMSFRARICRRGENGI